MESQHERLKQLMANAILELWKKETGCLTTVIIEGTVCITTGNNATIVIQVCDKFLGVLPDNTISCVKNTDRASVVSRSPAPPRDAEPVCNRSSSVIRPSASLDRVTTHDNSSALSTTSNYLADISSNSPHVSHIESERISRCWSSSSDQVFYPSKRNGDESHIAIDSGSDSDELIVDNPDDNDMVSRGTGHGTSCYTMADELSSSGYSSMLSKSTSSSLDKSQASIPAQPVSPDVHVSSGHDRPSRSHITPLRRRSASPAMMHSPSTSTPIEGSKRPRIMHSSYNNTQTDDNMRKVRSEGDTNGHNDSWSNHTGEHSISNIQSSNALDLSSSQRDHELALSSPQNYTAQVRDVIRSRILATKNSEGASNDGHTGAEVGTPVDSPTDFHASDISVNTSSAVTINTSGSHPYLNQSIGPRHTENTRNDVKVPLYPLPGSLESRENKPAMPDVKVPMFAHSGPASWPVANQDKLCHMPPPPPLFSNGKLMMPGNLSLLSVGLPNGTPMMPGSLSPSLFPGFFPAGLVPRSMPLPLGLNLGSMPNINKPPLVSPKTPSSQGSTTPSISLQENDEGRYWEYVSGRSTPEVTDINGNSEKVGANGEQKVYVCEYCNKQFLFKSKYHEHLPVHTNARPYQCHLCSRTYKYKYDLQVHLRTHMGIPTKSTICPFCMQKFETNKMLRNHIVELHRDRQKVTKEECTQPLDNLPPAL